MSLSWRPGLLFTVRQDMSCAAGYRQTFGRIGGLLRRGWWARTILQALFLVHGIPKRALARAEAFTIIWVLNEGNTLWMIAVKKYIVIHISWNNFINQTELRVDERTTMNNINQ